MFNDDLLYKFYSHERMRKVPVLFQQEVIKAIEEVLEEEARQYPFLYLAHTFQDLITENIKEA